MSTRIQFADAVTLCSVMLLTTVAVPPATPVSAQSPSLVTVTTTSKAVDFAGGQQVSDLPGPDGKVSLAEAIIAANATTGPQTIVFGIPTDDPGHDALGYNIVAPDDFAEQLVLTDDGTTIDGTTQPDGGALTLRGSILTANFVGLRVNSSGNTIRGLFFSFSENGVEINGNANSVVHCSLIQNYNAGVLVTGSGNTIGGTSSNDRNLISGNFGTGVDITGPAATNNVVLGNYIGVAGDGTSQLGNHSSGVSIGDGASGNAVGGTSPGARNVIAGNGHRSAQNTPVGSHVALGGRNNRVLGNSIGLDALGAPMGGEAKSGVEVTGFDNVVGGAEPGAGNVISDLTAYAFATSNRPAGIRITQTVLPGNVFEETTGIVIRGNKIGTDLSGTAPIANTRGIVVDDFFFDSAAHNVTIGGTAPGEGNVIAFNTLDGVAINESAPVAPTGIRISGNSTFDNGALGIDLAKNVSNGVTPNDPGDADAGANNRQNFPVILSAVQNGASTIVSGTIDTPSAASVTVEVFTSQAPDPTGHGEGQTFRATATPNASGNWTATLPGGLSGLYATATATDSGGSTSEFSRAVLITGGPAGSITVTSPNGGETWAAGSTRTITWNSTGVIGDVSIEVSRNGGASYESIAAPVPNTGAHAWAVSGPASSQSLVRVISVNNTAVRDTSNTPFEIAEGSVAVSSPGVYVPSTGAWFLRYTNTPGPADLMFTFGPPGAASVPIVGDWDGDGVDSPGLYVPTTGAFFLKNSSASGPADIVFVFGASAAGFVPMAGDWDGDGDDTVGLYAPVTGAFFLKNANTPGPADVVFSFGSAGGAFVPLAGDWNGDGDDTVGIYVPAAGAFFLKNSNTPGAADVTASYGPPGAIPIAGDFDGDGDDTIGVYVASTGAWFLRNTNTPGPADLVYIYGPPGVTPLAGRY
jgi:hypothetical protein